MGVNMAGDGYVVSDAVTKRKEDIGRVGGRGANDNVGRNLECGCCL